MKYLRLIFIISAIFSLSNCDKEAEVQPKDYPFVVTNLPEVNSDGAVFSATITSLGTQKILKYGFVWSAGSNPTIKDCSKLIDKTANKGIYSCNVNTGLIKGQKYYVRAYILTDQYEVYGKEKSFTSHGSLPPVINNFEPKFGPIGTQVIIEGENFALSKNDNTVKFGDTEVIVDSVLENRLIVTIPKITKPEKVRVSVKTAGMTVMSKDSFDLWFPWKKFGTYFTDKYLYGAAYFSSEDKGYVIPKDSYTLLEYDPKNNSFRIRILPEEPKSTPLAVRSETKAIILLNSNIYEFDLNTFGWTLITKYPNPRTRSDFLFYLNNQIYIGTFEQNYLGKYDQNQNIWLEMKSPNLRGISNYIYHSFNNQGYIFSGGIINYNPDDNTWTILSNSPFYSGYGFCNFIIGNNLYAGFGQTNNWDEGYVNTQFWEYSFDNNKWTRHPDCPQRMLVEFSFTFGDKGYVFSNCGPWYEELHDIWEFDPRKE